MYSADNSNGHNASGCNMKRREFLCCAQIGIGIGIGIGIETEIPIAALFRADVVAARQNRPAIPPRRAFQLRKIGSA